MRPAWRRGFPLPLLELKSALNGIQGLPAEQPGSLWPKTSLACLHDRRRLSPDQLQALLEVCRRCNGQLAALSPAAVRRAEIVVHQCRSLERTLSVQSVEFKKGGDHARELPPPDQEKRVAEILAEPEAADYWFAASRDGNRRAHYADPHLGVTLVHFLRDSGAAAAAWAEAGARDGTDGGVKAAEALLGAVRRFRQSVEGVVPGMYHWFDEDALHVTIRAIVL
jgi:hypothetical protein